MLSSITMLCENTLKQGACQTCGNKLICPNSNTSSDECRMCMIDNMHLILNRTLLSATKIVFT